MKFVSLLLCVTFAMAERGGILMPDGNILHFESVKNLEDNTEILTFGARNIPGHLNGIKLHDFNTGYIASKLVDHGICLISAIKHWKPTYINQRLVKYPPIVNQTITPMPMTRSEIVATAGAKIASFCDDYVPHMLLESHGQQSTHRRAVHDPRPEPTDDCKCQVNAMLWSMLDQQSSYEEFYIG
ncbi:uncharacterized protein LOC128548787 [Mercenaria mercenaria]|uniref:uncharacterized protein LOC128548787 n=1 Tax=Mercenaria mercenaria TaxID=6596 RepID=UPI00234EDF1A|nr:uncharacterized protein LOC128548787 [Mercenaria mercenaria]